MYELKADGEVVCANLERRPKQWQIDVAALQADRRGWNGVCLELWRDGRYIADVHPSDEAKARFA